MVAFKYQISCLLYAFNSRDETLLQRRTRPPNAGLWSPCGGKLRVDIGESPYACAIREAKEEIGVSLTAQDLRLTGIVSEAARGSGAHWLLFLFELKRRLDQLPPPHPEGEFRFFSRRALRGLRLPASDRGKIWPLFWRRRGGFFSAHCVSDGERSYRWVIEEER